MAFDTPVRRGRLHEYDPRTADGLENGEPPLCVFGPGGEFRTAWPPGPVPFSSANRPAAIRRVPLAGDDVKVEHRSRMKPQWRLPIAACRGTLDDCGSKIDPTATKRGVLPLVALGPQGLDCFWENDYGANQKG